MGGQEPFRVAGYQGWRDLLFVHWAMPDAALRPLVPAELEIESFGGQTYVSLIPFQIVEARPAHVPRALATSFLETNLRSYVRDRAGQSGIYFFSLDASSSLAVTAARLLYGLPYFSAAMSLQREDARIQYTCRRRTAQRAHVDVTWSIGDPAAPAPAHSLDYFLIERYRLYVVRRTGLYRARVRHRPYPLRRVAVERLSQTMLDAAGLGTPSGPPLCHYSTGVDVEISWLERVGGRSPEPVER
jgi:uncharacterized protein YqjF (DUF2071 family)